jgi:hypothetical protein
MWKRIHYRGTAMSIHLPLDNMTLVDKLEAMEALWADISRKPADLASPSWHKDILDERRQLVAEGKLKFLDWDTAIADLRKELRRRSPTSLRSWTCHPCETNPRA